MTLTQERVKELFDTPGAAALRYNEAAILHFGEFAYLNEVSE